MEQVVWVAQAGFTDQVSIVGIYSTLEKAVEAITAYAKDHDGIELKAPDEELEIGVFWDVGTYELNWYQVAKFTVDKDWRQK